MIMPFHLAGMSLPISPKLPGLLRSVVREQRLELNKFSTLTFNFRSPDYSAETGGVHPGRQERQETSGRPPSKGDGKVIPPKNWGAHK